MKFCYYRDKLIAAAVLVSSAYLSASLVRAQTVVEEFGQWTIQLQVVITAHPGCEVVVDTVRFGIDAETTAAFDRNAPTLLYRPETNRWRYLPRTLEALREGRSWRVVVLGDSIANDLYHSFFNPHLNAMYPGADVQLIQSVAGSAGWHYFLAQGEDAGGEDRVKSFVLDHRPDLVLIAGMSNRDVKDLRELVRRIREGTTAEILAVSAAVCQAHYRDSMSPPPVGSVFPVTSRTPLWAAMAETAKSDLFGFFDMARAWEAFLWAETRPLEWYTRDTSHLNARGKEVVGRLMAGFFQPEDCPETAATVTLVYEAEVPPKPSKGAASAPLATDDRPAAAELVGRLVSLSPALTLSQIAPYKDAFRAVEYEVLHPIRGPLKEGEKIVVVQQTMKNSRPVPAAAYLIGARHRLTLGLWEHFPDHDTLPLNDTLDRLDALLYYSRASEECPVIPPGKTE